MAAGQAASAMLTMAVLQVFQAKMLQARDQQGPDSAPFKNVPPACTPVRTAFQRQQGVEVASANDLSDLKSVWDAEVDLFASKENTHCPLFFSLMSAPLDGDALTSQWPRKRKYEFSPVKIVPLVLQKIREEQEIVLLVAPNWPNQP